MKQRVNIEKIAKGLRAERRGNVHVRHGYFGAIQLAADVQARFRTPKGGGRGTDPSWTAKRLLPLAEESLQKLAELARTIEEKRHVHIEPMQVAALLLERTLDKVTEEEAENIVSRRAAG
jgi:hypothetical protein